MEKLFEPYASCRLCPRACGARRTEGDKGICASPAVPLVAHSMLHMWEEPCLSGQNGSGAVFFSGCSLGCVYCQNAPISRGGVGKEYDADGLCSLFFSLEAQGAHNINLVTAAHYAPHVARAIGLAKGRGLSVPIVYNSSGYESVDTLKMLDGLVDVYLPDFRYLMPETARRYSNAPDYPAVAEAAIAEMVRQTGAPVLDGEGIMRSGTVVRLLLLPKHLIEAKMILRKLYLSYGERIYISLMSQYTPVVSASERFKHLSERVSAADYASLVEYAVSLGITQAFTQEGEAASESFIPRFGIED